VSDELDEARADLNALIREAHEAIKDLNKASREAYQIIARADEVGAALSETVDVFEQRVREFADVNIRELVDERVGGIIDEFLNTITANMGLVQDAIYQRFEAMTEELTEGQGKKAWNNLPLPEYLISQHNPFAKKKEG
jgi:ABC-type transporter Mla subunit MlaD